MQYFTKADILCAFFSEEKSRVISELTEKLALKSNELKKLKSEVNYVSHLYTKRTTTVHSHSLSV